jgi:hypothetical protein
MIEGSPPVRESNHAEVVRERKNHFSPLVFQFSFREGKKIQEIRQMEKKQGVWFVRR